MRQFYLFLVLLFSAFLISENASSAFLQTVEAEEVACEIREDNFEVILETLNVWQKYSPAFYAGEKTPPVWWIVLGEKCVHHIKSGDTRGAGKMLTVNGHEWFLKTEKYEGLYQTPGGEEIPAAPIAYTSFNPETGQSYVVLASIDIWKSVFKPEDSGEVPSFFSGVAWHEFTHLAQIQNVVQRAEAIQAAYPDVPENISDTLFQDQFQQEEYFEGLYNEARIAWASAILAENADKKRIYARQALKLYRERQKDFYGDLLVPYRELEDIFLSMEGSAVWLSNALTRKEGKGFSDKEAAVHYKDSMGEWAQQEGMLMATLVSQISEDWLPELLANDEDLLTLPTIIQRWAMAGE